ncbi:MAG: hypothetical protein ACLSHC_00605 [Bilophila wadsworthia]
MMPLSRVLTSLGRSVGAREGQHFSVWSVNYAVKGGSGDESSSRSQRRDRPAGSP